MSYIKLFSIGNGKDFWGEYKLMCPHEAKAIELITGENFYLFSNIDAKEKCGSLLRLAKKNNCDISHVRKKILDLIQSEFDSEDLREQVIPMLDIKMTEESIRYNIKRTNTSAYYMRNWILEIVRNPFIIK